MKTNSFAYGFFRSVLTLLVGMSIGLMPALATTSSIKIDIVAPPGSIEFGKTVKLLPNGNIVVIDPAYVVDTLEDAGAVFLYNGRTGAMISSLTGSAAGDLVGIGGIVVLTNGNFVVSSPRWSNGPATQAGAATWCSGTAGCTGTVTADNSLVGSTAGDQVGFFGDPIIGFPIYGNISPLSNGNYVVMSPNWSSEDGLHVGAVTWCSGALGCTGAVSPGNSRVGSTADDRVGGLRDIVELSSGDYVVEISTWTNGDAAGAGAATWCSGTAPCTGPVTAGNSLVGSTANDRVGSQIVALADGNYVVANPYWSEGGAAKVGAVTWCSRTAGCTGTVSPGNSLVGSTAGDQIGGVWLLESGNYVVSSYRWSRGAEADAGSVTWCSGTLGCKGEVSASNSLVGAAAGDNVGSFVTRLSTGDYVVSSPHWSSAGAVTWCSGTTGCTGEVSASNSLVGSTAGEPGGYQLSLFAVRALPNGSYAVMSPEWSSGGLTGVGAVTWCSGTVGCQGAISASNSLVGSHAGDKVGSYHIEVMSDSSYVVSSINWSNGGAANAGAATWCSGTEPCTGAVSDTNSLVGTTAGDYVGDTVVELTNGSYVVGSRYWSNGAAPAAGAATWCAAAAPCTGVVSIENSLEGSTANDYIGAQIVALSNGNYVVSSSTWSNSAAANAGSVTLCSGTGGCTGTISAATSLVGSKTNDYVGTSVGALTDGGYVVSSPAWSIGAVANVGAVTWCGEAGCTGVLSAASSLVGSTAGDQVGSLIWVLGNGAYAIRSPHWSNSASFHGGAVTLCSEVTGCAGEVNNDNSLLLTSAPGGATAELQFNSFNNFLVVARPSEGLVTLFKIGAQTIYLPLIFR